MKVRGLLIAALLLAGMAGLVYWSNQAEKAKKNKPNPNAPPKIIDIAKDDIVRLEIDKPGSKAVALRKGDDGNWKLTSPEPLRADQNAVTSLVSSVAKLDSSRLIEKNATNLADYGLTKPQMTVMIGRKKGKALKLLIGDKTPTGANYYAKLTGDPRLFTLDRKSVV